MLVDVFDVLLNVRLYKFVWIIDKVEVVLKEESGKYFDFDLV